MSVLRLWGVPILWEIGVRKDRLGLIEELVPLVWGVAVGEVKQGKSVCSAVTGQCGTLRSGHVAAR